MTDSKQGIGETIDRYLANRLSDAERDLVETRIVGDADFRREVELTQALRDGLRELQKQGEVAPLCSNRVPGCGGVHHSPSRRPCWRSRSVSALSSISSARPAFPPALVVASLQFEHTRGAEPGPDVTWQRVESPTLLEMRFDVGFSPSPSYGVLIERASPAADTTVFTAASVGIGLDGATGALDQFRRARAGRLPHPPRTPAVGARSPGTGHQHIADCRLITRPDPARHAGSQSPPVSPASGNLDVSGPRWLVAYGGS